MLIIWNEVNLTFLAEAGEMLNMHSQYMRGGKSDAAEGRRSIGFQLWHSLGI